MFFFLYIIFKQKKIPKKRLDKFHTKNGTIMNQKIKENTINQEKKGFSQQVIQLRQKWGIELWPSLHFMWGGDQEMPFGPKTKGREKKQKIKTKVPTNILSKDGSLSGQGNKAMIFWPWNWCEGGRSTRSVCKFQSPL